MAKAKRHDPPPTPPAMFTVEIDEQEAEYLVSLLSLATTTPIVGGIHQALRDAGVPASLYQVKAKNGAVVGEVKFEKRVTPGKN